MTATAPGREALARVNPPALCPPVQNLYSQVVIAPAGRTAYLAGQVALDASGELVGPGDYAAQARQAFLNVKLALEGVGATPADMVRHNIYVVDHRPELVPVIFGAAQEVYGEPWPLTASTLLGVQALGLPGWLIEVEATALLP
ncbi:enamine deaminase RidA (YjgF/YER057c/UK114 family) [Thermocatellispora tengchongensis]|uniref:Enamine deaminase RidA (YjgF/YER057c/UK114 family) n=1 Tax=Thermocatellispora tengchongensis TaxID=1073253 RepID=A0A840P081_9ACTN|nr:RidA family protein [Thermocatellispora tengchongensis]MBB5131311.1 enamine deaminase RidA (YjgF/YER057c/UK114 family) [Thermocatellispora tengchongensis]